MGKFCFQLKRNKKQQQREIEDEIKCVEKSRTVKKRGNEMS